VNISIVSGWLPVVIEVLAVLTLVFAVDWRGGRWRRQLGFGVPIAVLASLITGLVLWLGSRVSGGTPWWPLAWGAVLVLAVVVAVVGWSGAGRGRRIVSVVAVVLAVAVVLGAVNARSDTFPTVGRLVTDEPEHLVDLPGIIAIREEVARTGMLPKEGVVVTVTIPPTVSHFATRPAYVYLPPACCPVSRAVRPTGPRTVTPTPRRTSSPPTTRASPRSSSCPTRTGSTPWTPSA